MKLLKPFHLPLPTPADGRSGFSPPASFPDGSHRTGPPVPDSGGGDKIYVAVGKSVDKAVSLLHWAFRRFNDGEICILHVHQPSPLIPTLLGKLPATQANSDVVCAYRRVERDQMKKLLLDYISICARSKVKASIITKSSDQVREGIVDLVNEYGVRKLVMGAGPDSCMKVKNCSKSSYVSKNAPSFSQIWFINKGRLLYTRERAEGELHQDYGRSSSSTSYIAGSTSLRHLELSGSSDSGYSSSTELDSKLEQVNMEAEVSRNEAFRELLKRKGLEDQASKAYNKVKAYESAHSRESELRKTSENALTIAKRELEQLSERKEKTANDLRMAIINISLLENQLQEANRKHEESTEELKLIQASIATLTIEKLAVQKHRFEAANWLEKWKIPKLPEFSLLDLETATCGFSESFKIGVERCGFSVYKGEISNKTVMIKKPHPNNLEAQSEFQKEVQIIGKLRHKNLLNLIGLCPEACALVYDYVPMSLESTSNSNWKTRTRIISEIGNSLLFLHSRPEKILHGDLKPENILLDSEFGCKLCNFRFSRLVNEKTIGSFLFTDPEFLRTGSLTVKSDVYSFGMIILWLLTGSRSGGLAGEVRKAVLGSNLGSVLDALAGEWPNFVARRLAELGLRCCESNRRDRPAVTPVLVKELERLSGLEDRQVPSFFLCPILKEIMHDPQLAADGFTYEGDALREWFKNGHETSPMTNLKLSHLNLTPNHSVRVAIQDWLCNP